MSRVLLRASDLNDFIGPSTACIKPADVVQTPVRSPTVVLAAADRDGQVSTSGEARVQIEADGSVTETTAVC
jgi:hypothetical protein